MTIARARSTSFDGRTGRRLVASALALALVAASSPRASASPPGGPPRASAPPGTFAPPGSFAPSGPFAAIDALRARGEIDAGTWHLLRVATLRDPGRVPAELRTADPTAGGGDAGTAALFEAQRWAAAHRGEPAGEALLQLLAPPPDLPLVIDSASLPLRVTYASVGQQPLAAAVLSAVETSWTVQSSWGFTLPAIEPGTTRYRLRIEDTGMGGGAYCAPYAYDDSTPRTDCFSYIVVDPANPPSYASFTVAHEFNHAMQAAMDCAEVIAFFENTATYIMSQVFPGDWFATVAFMPLFQGQPWQALDYMKVDGSDGYEYGGALFPIFLADRYAPAAGPQLLAEIWQAAEQGGGTNEPDYLDAIATVLPRHGGPATLDAVLTDFTEARYFVASRDDGAHLARAAEMDGAEVALTAEHSASSLPLTGATPPVGRRPAPLGSNHVLVHLPQPGSSYRVDFDGEDSTRWSVRLLLVGGAGTLSQDLPLDPASGQGSAVLDAAGRDGLVLSIANLAAAGYDPDPRSWPTAGYTYAIEEVELAPEIASVEPAELPRGSVGATVVVRGAHFAGGEDFAVIFDDPGLQLAGVQLVDASTLSVVLDVLPAAALGPHDLTVRNANGLEGTGVGVLTVTEAGGPPPPPPGTPSEETGEGCGSCTGEARPTAAARARMPLLLAAVGATLLRGPRRPPRRGARRPQARP